MQKATTSRVFNVITYVLLVLVLMLSLFPIIWLFSTSLKPRELTFEPSVWLFTPTFENYQEVLTDQRFVGYMQNSLILATSTTTVAVMAGALAAYGIARFRFRGRAGLRFLFLLPQITPPIAIVVPLFVMFQAVDLTDTYVGLILANLTLTMPLTIWMLTGFFEDSPVEMEEAAMIDGCTRVGALVRVVLPVMAPGLAATAVLGFIYSWNEFLYASILAGRDTRPLAVAITGFLTNRAIDWGRTTAAGTLILLPVLIFAFFTQRYLIRGLSRGAVKG